MKKDFPQVSNLVILLFCAAIWYLLRRGAGDYTHNKAITEVFIVFFFYFLGEYAFWKSRYYMPFASASGHAGSIGQRPVVIGDWAIFALGETFNPVHLRGKLSTMVVPKSHVKRAGRNYLMLTLVQQTPIDNLPEIVNYYLRQNINDFNLDNIYFGVYTEPFALENQEVIADYEKMIEGLNRAVNTRDQIIEGDDDIITEKVKFAREVVKPGFSLSGIFKRKRTADDEGGE